MASEAFRAEAGTTASTDRNCFAGLFCDLHHSWERFSFPLDLKAMPGGTRAFPDGALLLAFKSAGGAGRRHKSNLTKF